MVCDKEQLRPLALLCFLAGSALAAVTVLPLLIARHARRLLLRYLLFLELLANVALCVHFSVWMYFSARSLLGYASFGRLIVTITLCKHSITFIFQSSNFDAFDTFDSAFKCSKSRTTNFDIASFRTYYLACRSDWDCFHFFTNGCRLHTFNMCWPAWQWFLFCGRLCCRNLRTGSWLMDSTNKRNSNCWNVHGHAPSWPNRNCDFGCSSWENAWFRTNLIEWTRNIERRIDHVAVPARAALLSSSCCWRCCVPVSGYCSLCPPCGRHFWPRWSSDTFCPRWPVHFPSSTWLRWPLSSFRFTFDWRRFTIWWPHCLPSASHCSDFWSSLISLWSTIAFKSIYFASSLFVCCVLPHSTRSHLFAFTRPNDFDVRISNGAYSPPNCSAFVSEPLYRLSCRNS